MKRRALRLVLLLTLALPAGAVGGCSGGDDSSSDDSGPPNVPFQPFLEEFNGGLASWRLTPHVPTHQMGAGNPLPSMEVGSSTGQATGGLSIRTFDVSNGLVVEADVYWQPPSGGATAEPQFWIGLSDEDDATGISGVAAGMWVDDAEVLHFQVNGADIGETAAPSTGTWHRFTTTIRSDRVVEFRVDDVLLRTGGFLDSWYLVRAIEACGIGYPERPIFDNVAARLP